LDKGDGGPCPAQAFSESNQADSAGAGVGGLEPIRGMTTHCHGLNTKQK